MSGSWASKGGEHPRVVLGRPELPNCLPWFRLLIVFELVFWGG